MHAGDILAPGKSRETEIRRDRFGHWFNGKDEIDHPSVIASFNAWIERAEDGRYCLSNSINWAYVAIEGAPYFVLHCRVPEETLRLSGGRILPLADVSLSLNEEGKLLAHFDGDSLYAEFTSTAMSDISESLIEKDDGYALKLGEQEISIQ